MRYLVITIHPSHKDQAIAWLQQHGYPPAKTQETEHKVALFYPWAVDYRPICTGLRSEARINCEIFNDTNWNITP